MTDPNGKWRIPIRRYNAKPISSSEVEFTEDERGSWCEAPAVHHLVSRLQRHLNDSSEETRKAEEKYEQLELMLRRFVRSFASRQREKVEPVYEDARRLLDRIDRENS